MSKTIIFCHSLHKGKRDILKQTEKLEPYRQNAENRQQGNTSYLHQCQLKQDQQVFHHFSVVQSLII